MAFPDTIITAHRAVPGFESVPIQRLTASVTISRHDGVRGSESPRLLQQLLGFAAKQMGADAVVEVVIREQGMVESHQEALLVGEGIAVRLVRTRHHF